MKKLAIVCGSPSSEMQAPFSDSDYDVWVLGNRINRYPRYDLIFEIHDDLSEHGDPIRYAQFLADKKVPMIVGEAFPVTADHISVFPFEDSKSLFGSIYLTSSSAYMLCFAMLRGYEYVELYGVDMAVDDHEYFYQRPCMEAWIGFARGSGVNVVMPAQSPVYKSDYIEGKGCGGKPDFSLPPFTQAAFSDMASDHQAKMDAINSQIEALQRQYVAHDGARQVYAKMAQIARAVEAGQTIESLKHGVALK